MLKSGWRLIFGLMLLGHISLLQARMFTLESPNGALRLTAQLKNGHFYYSVSFSQRPVIKDSQLGLKLRSLPALAGNFSIQKVERRSHDTTWIQPWGECEAVRDHYNEMVISLISVGKRELPPRILRLRFRCYDDGLGFRYEIPAQKDLDYVEISDELTEFRLAGDYQAWWIKAYQPNRYEYLYQSSPISEIDTVHTPLTMESRQGFCLSIHEAALADYASMTLCRIGQTDLKCDLVPWSDGVKVRGPTPLKSPWRTIQIGRTAGDLITSNLILNLNEPCRLADVSWIKPGKYIGIWWGMHLDKWTWGSGLRHGATTENAQRYIDFAAKYGFDGVLVEGWNVNWDGDWVQNGALFNFTQPHPDFDLEKVAQYAASKGVQLIGHHETGADVLNYERQMEEAFRLYQRLGVHIVKTGYVGHGRAIKRFDDKGNLQREWHHGQYMVAHYRKVIETAAKYQIMLDVHEPIKDTGERRTYPNMMTREGARGMEYDAWSPDGGNPPEHTTILPFTRLLGGPMDFTPGILDLFYEEYKPHNRVNTTLAKQLAYYVVIYSPLQMAADLIENYEHQPAFQFIRDVPVDWRQTKVLHAKIGDYVTIVRQDRHSEDWYLGSITDEHSREWNVQLDFLKPGTHYIAEIYADAPDADWRSNPLAINIQRRVVTSATLLKLKLAAGGGLAVRFRPASAREIETIPPY